MATPLECDELGKRDFDPGRYAVRNVFRRLSRKGDPWEDIGQQASSLSGARRRFDELRG